jgi:hypothetical protein
MEINAAAGFFALSGCEDCKNKKATQWWPFIFAGAPGEICA